MYLDFQRLLLLLLAIIPLGAKAQSGLLQGADWAAVIEMTLPADPMEAKPDEDEHASAAILKLSAADYSLDPYIDHSLNVKLWQLARNGSWEMYDDPELTKRLPLETLMRRFAKPDTLLSFDPETYEERINITYDNRQFPFEASNFKVRQLLLYRNVDAVFDVQLLAIGPCLDDNQVAYWLKPPALSPATPEDNAQLVGISWAVRYTTESVSPQEQTWQEIKNTTGPVLERFLDRIRTDTLIELLGIDGEYVPAAQRACLFSCADTTVTFDPGTFQEVVDIVESGLDHEEVSELQLIQEWYWHEEASALTIRLVAVAPRYWVYEKGEKSYKALRFYRRCIE